ncbi:hypothetical protein E4U15_006691 [Claviceps sp. LM218 group G6]|nr:hypothetical protein E4U15_006691 [Claviceps sp. LM218 group G6]KAG6122956.1 hypothetical protein E4U14_002326 [Claviceps sp. LM454 group G7]
MTDVPHASSVDVSIPIENPEPPRNLRRRDCQDDKPPVENLLPRGFISTTATDENSLKIYFIHESQERTFNSDILILREFAAAWSSGERDVDKKIPFSDMQPCDIIVVK